tara:strand:+ start:1732 stop:3507 length:1776 start_codon:yes stop_codon:yes gene_type:complete
MFIITPISLENDRYTQAVNAANAQVDAVSFIRQACDLKITMFEKKLISRDELFYETDNLGWIFGTGIWSYRGKVGGEGLLLIIDDLRNDSLNRELLRGQYALLVRLKKRDHLILILDSSGIQNLYKSDEGIVSTSFMACLYSKEKVATLNRKAAIENLVTGHIVSPDTLINEIKRFHPKGANDFFIEKILINVNNPNERIGIPDFKNREEAMEAQLSNLDELFEAFRNLNIEGADFGLTGGLDSRLLLAFALRNWDENRISVYTNSRLRKGKEKVVDEPIAVGVSKAIGKDLKLGWMSHPTDIEEEHLYETVQKSFKFFDGHVKMHTQYFEAYNNSEFKLNLIGQSRLNTSGIGGEQYRNMERFGSGKWNLRSFLDFKTIKMVAGEALNREELNSLLDYLVPKVKSRLGVGDDLSRVDVKKYYNEILNGDRLGARNNMENKLYWFLSPYTEAKVSEQAYGMCQFIGNYNFTFQAEMLARVNERMGKVPTDYGFTPTVGLTSKMKVQEMTKLLIPWELFYHTKIKNLHKPGSYDLFNKLNKYGFIREYLDVIESIFPEVNFEHLNVRPDLMPIAVNLGCFIYELTKEGKLKV